MVPGASARHRCGELVLFLHGARCVKMQPFTLLLFFAIITQTSGFGGAIFKSFKTHHEAQSFVQANSVATASGGSTQGRKRPHESDAASVHKKQKANNTIPQLHITIHFDGGSRGNPGVAGAGAEVIIVNNNSTCTSDLILANSTTTYLTREYCGDRATNNYAEYKGLLAGLKQAKVCIEQYSSKQLSSTKSSPTNPLFLLQIYGDSNLVIQHLKGAWQCKHPNMKPLFHQCQQIIGEMKKMDSNSEVLLEHIYREQNKVADGKLHYQKKLLVLNDAVGRYHLT